MLVGQTVPDLCEHGQPADPRVEDAYGPWVAHCAALYLLDGDYTTKDPISGQVLTRVHAAASATTT